MKKILLSILIMSVMMIGLASASHNPAVVSYDTAQCGETTFTATQDTNGGHLVNNMYLLVDVDGGLDSGNIPNNGNDVSIIVGPFTETTTIRWRVFGGGERDYDEPLWKDYGESNFISDIIDYETNFGDNWNWTLSGVDDTNPFTTWNELEVNGCEPPCDITVNPPVVGWSYADDIPIQWSLDGDGCTSPTYNLHFNAGTCSPQNPTDWAEIVDSVNGLEYDWTSGIPSGNYCVRVSEDEGDDFGVSGIFYIDNIDPVADANGPYSCLEGGSVSLVGSASYDLESGIASYEWIVDSVSVYSGSSPTFIYDCLDGDALLDVELVVTDHADNSDSDFTTVEIFNIKPICDSITGPTDVAVGEVVTFTGSAHDVPADNPKLEFNWDFDDGGTALDENPTTHTYTADGTYTVILTVDDTDGGTDTCEKEIEVHEPIELDDQEVAAYYPLIADFGEDAGGWRAFTTGLTGMTWDDCEVIVGPSNLRTKSPDDGECRVRWDNDSPPPWGLTENPTNDEQGEHQVIIKVSNGEETEYFEFTVTVYSWIIDLNEGWNLISIPYVPEDTSINANGIGIKEIRKELSSIWSYEYGSESSWKCKKTTPGGSWSTTDCSGVDIQLTDMVPGRGYWLNMDEPAQLKGFGTQIAQGEGPGMPPEIEVPTNNWALIGRYGILGKEDFHYPGETPWDAGAIRKRTALESLTKQDNELHVFEVTEDAHLNEVHKLWNNEGYWLWIEDEKYNNAESEGYAPLDKYYMEDLHGCGRHNCDIIV